MTYLIEPLSDTLALHVEASDNSSDCECHTNLEVYITDKDGLIYDTRTVTMTPSDYDISSVSDMLYDADGTRQVSDSPELEQQICEDLIDLWTHHFMSPNPLVAALPEMLEALCAVTGFAALHHGNGMDSDLEGTAGADMLENEKDLDHWVQRSRDAIKKVRALIRTSGKGGEQ